MGGTSRLLGKSDTVLFDLAEKKEIPARKFLTKKSPRGYSYKFKVFDINKYQEEEKRNHLLDRTMVDEVESIDELKTRIFGNNF